MEKLGEVEKTGCPGSYQRSRFSDLKKAMVSNIVVGFFYHYGTIRGQVQAGKVHGGERIKVMERQHVSLVHMWQYWLCPY